MIKGILKASLPTIIVPAVIVGFVISYFGFDMDSLLAIIFLGQFYIIWAQLEVALRQTRLSTLEYEPEFKIETKKSNKPAGVTGNETSEKNEYTAMLSNTSKHLARNVHAEINIPEYIKASVHLLLFNLESEKQTIKKQKIKLADIGADKSYSLYKFEENKFINSRLSITLNYQNILGEPGRVTFIKDPDISEFIGVERVKMPGILLNSFEMLLSSRKRI